MSGGPPGGEAMMPEFSSGALPVRRPQRRRDEEEIDSPESPPDLQSASPRPWRGAPLVAALVCIAFLMLQMMPATHFRRPDDPTRTWIAFNNLSSPTGIAQDFSDEQSRAREFVNDINSLPVNIFICTDEKDLRPVFVVLNSTLSNTRHQKRIRFHVLTSEEERETWDAALGLLLPAASIHVISVADKLDLEAIRRRVSFRKDSRARESLTSPYNFLPFYLPRMFPGIPKMIYLDSDVVVQGDIEELFSTDLETHAAAAVEDCSQKFKSGYFNMEEIDRIREREAGKKPWVPETPFEPEACVFNRGVLLIDPAKWIEQNLTEAIEWWMDESLRSEKTLYRYGVSQPPFLLSLYNNYKKLDVVWNTRGLGRNELSEGERDYMSRMYSKRPPRRPFVSPKADHSKILHFNGKFKPWNRRSKDHPPPSLCGAKSQDCGELWWRYISPSTNRVLSRFHQAEVN